MAASRRLLFGGIGGITHCSLSPRWEEIFPAVNTPQFQVRMRAPTGTRVERTEVMALRAMEVIKSDVGPENVDITTDYVGVQPTSYPVNTIFLFTSGQHEAVLRVALKTTTATLTVLPAFYAILQNRAGMRSASLDPDDPDSRYHEHA
jgi:multidrug efflux pump subunit AcrB